MADATVAKFISQQPVLQQQLDDATGYAVIVHKSVYQFYLLADGGISATVTARAMKVSIDTELTMMAESETNSDSLQQASIY